MNVFTECDENFYASWKMFQQMVNISNNSNWKPNCTDVSRPWNIKHFVNIFIQKDIICSQYSKSHVYGQFMLQVFLHVEYFHETFVQKQLPSSFSDKTILKDSRILLWWSQPLLSLPGTCCRLSIVIFL